MNWFGNVAVGGHEVPVPIGHREEPFRMFRTKGRRGLVAKAVPAAVAVGVMAACAPPGSSAGQGGGGAAGSGEGVAAGASEEEWAEALKDMKPVTLEFGGLTTGPGNATTDAYVAWGDHVEELSGGKIEFKYDYAGAKVPLDKMADALSRGRMDMGMYIPAYQPEEWPVANTVGEMSIYGQPHPIAGRMATFAAQVEFGHNFDPLKEEAEGQGIHALYPLFSPSHDIKLQCTSKKAKTSLKDLKGTSVRVSSTNGSDMAKAIGMTPVSLTFPELFQGLQRGAVDCAVNSVGSTVSGGFVDIIDSWTFGNEVGLDWGETPSGFGISQKTWNTLPLAARQLLWDSQAELLAQVMTASFGEYQEAIAASRKAGHDFGTFDDDVNAKLKSFYAEQEKASVKELEKAGLSDDGQADVEAYQKLYDKWWQIVTDDLEYDGTYTWSNLDKDLDKALTTEDMAKFTDHFAEEVLLPHRPTGGS